MAWAEDHAHDAEEALPSSVCRYLPLRWSQSTTSPCRADQALRRRGGRQNGFAVWAGRPEPKHVRMMSLHSIPGVDDDRHQDGQRLVVECLMVSEDRDAIGSRRLRG